MNEEQYKKGYSQGIANGYNDGYFTAAGKHPKRNKYKVDNTNANGEDSSYVSGYNCGYNEGFKEGKQVGAKKRRFGKLMKFAVLGTLAYMGISSLFSSGKKKNNSGYSYTSNKNNVTLVSKVLGDENIDPRKEQVEPVYDHPDKTAAEYYIEGRLNTEQLLGDTLTNPDTIPTPKKLSPITQIRQELSIVVGNGENYDQVADAELYIQDKTNPDNVIAYGVGVMPSQVNEGCVSLLLTTMPSHKNGESRSMAGSKFNIKMGDRYCFGLEVSQKEESDGIDITYPFDDCPTFNVEQHNGQMVVLVDAQNQTEKASEGKRDELITSYEGRVFHKGPGIYRTSEGQAEPLVERVTPKKTKNNSTFKQLRGGR